MEMQGGIFVERKLKVTATSGYKYQDVPTLQVKGKYLEEFGFPIGTKVSVSLEQGRIIIGRRHRRLSGAV